MTNKASPPPYNHIDGKDDSQALETKQYPTPANINRTNFVKFFPPKGMKRVWVIDPSMKIPTTLLPPLSRGETEETRKNVELIAKGGDLDADIFILPASSVALTSSWKDISVTIHAASQTGWVNLRIHDAQSEDARDSRIPMKIHCKAPKGYVNIYLPRSFRGPLKLKASDSAAIGVIYSQAVKCHLTLLSEVDAIHQSFLGKFVPSEWDISPAWSGDELTVDTGYKVYIYFDDEDRIPTDDSGGCVCA